MARYWFRPRKYGYGARPSTWQGWALVAAFVAVIGALSLWLKAVGPPSSERILAHLALVGALTIAVVWVSWKKTDGEWRWRWGGED